MHSPWRFALELLICVFHPLTFWPVDHTNFRLMRGSFYYTCDLFLT